MKRIISGLLISILLFLLICKANEQQVSYALENQKTDYYEINNGKLNLVTDKQAVTIDITDMFLYKLEKVNGNYFYIFDIDNHKNGDEIEVMDISFHDEYDLGIYNDNDNIYIKVVYNINNEVKLFLKKINNTDFIDLFNAAIIIEEGSEKGNELSQYAFVDETYNLKSIDVPCVYSMRLDKEQKYLTDTDAVLDVYVPSTNGRNLDDDNIISLIPKTYFSMPGEYEYQGKEYKFHISTVAEYNNSEESIRFRSEVAIIDFDFVLKGSIANNTHLPVEFGFTINGGFTCKYLCYMKTDSAAWSRAHFNPHKISVVRSSYYTQNEIKLKNVSSGFDLVDINNNLSTNTIFSDTQTTMIDYALRGITSPYRDDLTAVTLLLSLIPGIETFNYGVSGALLVNQLIQQYFDYRDTTEIINRIKEEGLSIGNHDITFNYASNLIRTYNVDDEARSIILVDYFNICNIAAYFQLPDYFYRINLKAKMSSDSQEDFYLNGRINIFTTEQSYHLDFDKMKISWYPQEPSTNNYTDFNNRTSYTYKFTSPTTNDYKIYTNVDTNLISYDNFTWIKVYDSSNTLILFTNGKDVNTTSDSRNSLGLLKLQEGKSYVIQTGLSQLCNINYHIKIELTSSDTNLNSSYSFKNNIKLIQFTTYYCGYPYTNLFYSAGAISKSCNCDTIFEIYDSNFILIAEDDSGLWEDEGDDESNMNAYLEHIRLKNQETYYIKVIVNPSYNVYGTVNLEMNLEGPWVDQI